MVRINSSDITNFDYIGHGGFGRVYRNGDYIYKIYNMDLLDNPSLIYRPLKFKRLMSVDKSLKFTDLVKDVLFLDGRFAGVVLPFYDGNTLINLKGLKFKDRLKISYDLVRNSKELTSYFIYPLDYKLDNIMFSDGEVKFIDLDDCLTKACYLPHLLGERRSIKGLDETIKEFLKEYNIFISNSLKTVTDKNVSVTNYSYDDLDEYLEGKSCIFNYIFISDKSDFSNISLLKDSNYRVIYTSNKLCYEDDILREVMNLKKMGISIYDIIPYYKVDYYLENVMYDCAIELNGNDIIERGR